MTRINLVEPSQLTDKHLMAEYRELPRVFTAVLKLQEQGKSLSDVDIPNSYVLGQGHVKFFYNKINWIERRYSCLHKELKSRNFKLDRSLFNEVMIGQSKISSEWCCVEFIPSPEEIYLNMARICKRSKIDKVMDELSAD